MLFEKALYQVGLVRREVVQDDMHLAIGGLRGDYLFQKRDELLTGVPGGGLADDLTGLRIQSGVQGQRSVPVVFKPMLLCASR